MNAAAQTSDLTRLSTGSECLFAVLRWLVLLLAVHWIIACARKLAGGLREPSTGPDDNFLARNFGTTDRTQILARVTRALRRATIIEDRLLDLRPTEQGFPVEVHRAVRAVLIDICRELGFFSTAGSGGLAPASRRPRTARRGAVQTHPYSATTPTRRRSTVTTGPPAGRGCRRLHTLKLRRGCALGAFPEPALGRATAFTYWLPRHTVGV